MKNFISEKFIVVRDLPVTVDLVDPLDPDDIFGTAEEETSEAFGAERVSVAKITLWAADVLHGHKEREETYIFVEGRGELFLDDEIFKVGPGVKAIIKPGVVHAARPKNDEEMVFWCVSVPAFNPEDVYNDPRGREW